MSKTTDRMTVNGQDYMMLDSEARAGVAAEQTARLAGDAAVLAQLAPEFAENTANTAGEYVTYQGTVYKLPAGHDVGVTWANTQKVATNLGSSISDLNRALGDSTDNPLVDSWVNGYNLPNFDTSLGSPTSSGSMRYAKIPCNKGDVFTISAKGATAARAWAFADTNDAIITRAEASVTVTNMELTAPANGYLVINDTKENGAFIRRSYKGRLLDTKVTEIISNLEYRTLMGKTPMTAFPIVGDAWNGLVPASALSPYYIGATRCQVCTFTLTLNAGQTDFWVGTEINDEMTFVGGNAIGANNAYRRIRNNSTTATIIADMPIRSRLYAGNTYEMKAVVAGKTFSLYADGSLIQRFTVQDNENIRGVAFLNLGIVSGNITNLVGYFTTNELYDVVTKSQNIPVTDDIVSAKGWSNFKEFPKENIYAMNLSAANYKTLGFPIAKAGTFITISPRTTTILEYSYNVYLYICNGLNEFNNAYIAFGHGTKVTPWSSINTFSGVGNINSFADAVVNKKKITFIGDSIIAGLGGTGYDATESGGGDFLINYGVDRYVNLLGTCWVNSMISYISTVYGNNNVKNHGVGGITTAGLYNNFDALVGDAEMLIISVGTNNHDNLSQIDSYLPQIAEKCIANNIKFMIMTNTPNNTAEADEYTAVKGHIVSVCNSLGIPVYDMYSEFEMYLKLKGLSLTDVLNSDGIHPNDAGYAIMFDIAKKLFQI